MSKYPHLRNAPITEALFDIRVVAHQGFEASAFTELKDVMGHEYPNVEEQRDFQAQFGFRGGKPVPPTQKELGLRGLLFRSADNHRVVQYRIDGFTFNCLPPYTDWDSLLPKVMDLWKQYVATAKPQQITRVAVRYINALTLPLPISDLSDYLIAPPRIPPKLPQTMTSFLFTFVVEELSAGTAANVTLALEPQSAERARLIFDIDAYVAEQLEPHSQDIPKIFESLREMKNRIFFGTLRKKLLKDYK